MVSDPGEDLRSFCGRRSDNAPKLDGSLREDGVRGSNTEEGGERAAEWSLDARRRGRLSPFGERMAGQSDLSAGNDRPGATTGFMCIKMAAPCTVSLPSSGLMYS